jgi:hypothetical protein
MYRFELQGRRRGLHRWTRVAYLEGDAAAVATLLRQLADQLSPPPAGTGPAPREADDDNLV